MQATTVLSISAIDRGLAQNCLGFEYAYSKKHATAFILSWYGYNIFRSSWGNPDIPGVVTKLAFFLGRPEDGKKQEKLQEENKKSGDIVQGDFLDTYRNLSYKAIMANLWVSEFCDQAEFVVKTDDDIFIDLYEVWLRCTNDI